MRMLTYLLAVVNIRLGDQDILDQLVVLLLVSGEAQATGLQKVRHAVQLKHCYSEVRLEVRLESPVIINTRPTLAWAHSVSSRPDLQPPPRPLISANQGLCANNQPITNDYTLGHI